MSKIKYYNKTTGQWEYAETGGMPVKGTHYWTDADKQPLLDKAAQLAVEATDMCRLTITLGSNQLDKSVLEGLQMSVIMPSGTTENRGSGESINFLEGSVSVTFPDVAGYKKPDTFVCEYAKGFVNKKFNYLAEVVTINPLCDGIATTNGYVVNATGAVALTEGAVLGSEVSGVTQWLVPHGTTMTIVPNSVEGYVSSEISYVASLVESTVDLVWKEVVYEIFIADTTGNLWVIEDWDESVDAVGVAVITDQVRLIVAPDEWYGPDDGGWNGNRYSAWGGVGKTVSDIVTTEDQSIALTDFAGSSNTDQIIAQLSGTRDNYSGYYTGAPAAEYCRAYSKGCKGVGEWYLPSAGEMNILVTNKDAINTALTKISGETLGSVYWTWTSTQYGSDNVWSYGWSYEGFYYNFKNYSYGVRPVCAF